jgi:hypothetical protein
VLLGTVWYSPRVFGAAWMRMVNITPEMAEKGKRRMLLMALVGFLAAMLIAWVMSYVGVLLGVYDWFGAIELGFWCWIGFVAPTMLGIVLWEQKPFKLYLINVLYWLVAFVLMALVLVLGTQFLSGSSYASTSGSTVIQE